HAYPDVQLQIKVINRPVDLVEERIDVALRARARFDTEPQWIVRTFGQSRLVLAMGRELHAARNGTLTIEQIATLPTLSMNEELDEDVWELVNDEGTARTIRHRP